MASRFQIHLCATRSEMGLLCCEGGEAFDTKLLLAPACSTLCSSGLGSAAFCS